MVYKSSGEFKDYNNQVFVFGSHQYALYFWYKAYECKIINRDSLIVHIDLHSDFLDRGIEFDTPVTSGVIKKRIESNSIRNDDFIKASFQCGIANDIAFCCNPDHVGNDFNGFINFESPVNIKHLLDMYKRDKSKLSKKETAICKKIIEGRIILDIDLDFFLEFEPCKGAPSCNLVPKKESKIIEEIDRINHLFKYAAITTIATSPEIFVSDEAEEHLKSIQSIFTEYFASPINFDSVISTYF